MQTCSRQRISTDAVAPAERVAFWEARSVETTVRLRCATFDGDVLAATQTLVRLGDVRMTDIVGNAHVIERTVDCVRATPKASVFASLVLQSDAFFYHPGGCSRAGPGDIIVYDTDRPYVFGFPGPMRQCLFDVPITALDGAGVRAPGQPTRIAADSTGGRFHGAALRQLAQRLLRAPDARALAACRDSVREVVIGLLDKDAGAHAGGPAATHLLAAEAFVERHLGEPELDSVQVAAACGVSVRHLARLFAQRGVPLMQYLMERRLQTARAALIAQPARSIAQVAYRTGFVSASHFARVFRVRFGATPREYRRLAATGQDLP